MLKRSFTAMLLALSCVTILVAGCSKPIQPEDFSITLENGDWLPTGEPTATAQLSEKLFKLPPEQAQEAPSKLDLAFRLEPYGKSTQAVKDPEAQLTVAGHSYVILFEENQGLAVYNHREGHIYGGQLDAYLDDGESLYPFTMTVMYWPAKQEIVVSMPIQWIWLEFGDISLDKDQLRALQRVKE